MARKNYSEDFRRQAVDLYLNTPDAIFKAIAEDQGIARGTLQNWVYARHPEGRTAPESTTSTVTTPAKSESNYSGAVNTGHAVSGIQQSPSANRTKAWNMPTPCLAAVAV